MTQILTYYGAVCGVLSAVAMALHVFGLDQTKYGQLFCKGANDIAGIYKSLAGVK